MSGVFSPRSEQSLDVTESGDLSSRIPSRRTPRSQRTPRSGRQQGSNIDRDARKLKALAKWQSRTLKDKSRSKNQLIADEEQSIRVKNALDRRQRANQQFHGSLAQATRAKMVKFPDLLPEGEQMKFFHEIFDQGEAEKRNEITIDPETGETILDEEPILNFAFEVNSMAWADRAIQEEEAKIYCLPGQESELDPMTDNIEMIRQTNDFNGIFIGDEIQISDNLRAWLKRDGWLVNGVPYCLEEAVYSYPVRHWTLPFGNAKPIKTKSPRVYPSEIPTSAAPIDTVAGVTTDFELVVGIKYYKFIKHPLMTEEMKLESDLLKAYDAYVDANKKLSTSKYEKTLIQYREAWKRKIGESQTFQGLPSSPSKISIAQLLQEVIAVRRRRNQELKNVKVYYNKVFDLWGQLFMVRQNQGYNTSKSNLKIYSVEPPEDDREIWDKDLQDELEELRSHQSNLEDEYRREMKIYKKEKSAAKKEGGDASGLLPPNKPPEWNEDAMRQELIENALRDRRNPTENIKTLIVEAEGLTLSTLGEVTNQSDRSKMENFQKYKYYIKLFYNGVFVTQSEQFGMTEQMTIHDGNFYKIRTREKPKSMRVEVYEVASRFKQKMIGDAVLDIPSSETSDKNKIEHQTIFPQRMTAEQPVNGILISSLFWGTDEESGKILSPKNYRSEIIYDHRKPDIHDPELHLYSEGEDVIDDPNDPAYVQPSADGTPVSEAYNNFILNPYMTDGFFCGAEEIEKSKRLRFLQLREQEVTEFVGRKMVPLKEHEIQDSEFKDYEERLNQNYANIPLGDRRAAIRQERKRMKEIVMQRLRAVSKTLSFNEVVIEDPIPEFGALLGNFTKFFEARRPLRPERKVAKRRPNEQVREPKIIISIRSAQNLPVRINKMDEEETFARDLFYGGQGGRPNRRVTFDRRSSFDRPGMSKSRRAKTILNEEEMENYIDSKRQSLKPFVTVSFLDSEERTSVAFGSNPSWNEQMELPWAQGISRLIGGSISKEEYIYINVFDEDLMIQEDVDSQGEFTSFAMKNWIGGVTVPLSSLISRGLVEGELHLQVPPLMFNYAKESEITPTMDVYISIDANSPTSHDDQQFPTNETADMTQAADDIISNLRKRFPDREYFGLVADLKGETRFVTRYVCPLNIPDELHSESLTRDQMAHRMARFVSLIPYETDSIYFSGSYDLWGNNLDFLSCLIGDDEEHACLLLSYFLTIELESPKIIFGYSINAGSVCWVTTKDGPHVRLWNPLTGDSYFSTDPKCPLTAIYCAADAFNIYYNVQSDVRPNRINWNFDNWTKLWAAPLETPLETIQVREFNYDQIDMNTALRDASNLERFIKERIRSWRLGQLTRFRSDIAQMMKRILEQCEHLAMAGEHVQNYMLEPIVTKFARSRIVGYPLHLRLQSTDLNQIEKTIKTLGIHKSNRSNVEFGIAVHIQPYPGNIQSLWIYLTQITPL